MRVLDAHVHFFSHRFFATLAKGLPESRAEDEETQSLKERIGSRLSFDLDFPAEDATRLAGRWVEELDRHDVDRSVRLHVRSVDYEREIPDAYFNAMALVRARIANEPR